MPWEWPVGTCPKTPPARRSRKIFSRYGISRRRDSAAARKLLWVSVSGRAMAQAARRAGQALQVVDFYADSDTHEAAARVTPLPGDARGFDARLEAFLSSRTGPRCARPLLLPGSGFEARPELLAALERRYTLLGPRPEQLRRVWDVAGFAALLDRLGVPRPELRLRAEGVQGNGWLVKRRGGMGGGHVHFRSSGECVARDAYLQRYCPGHSLSLVFLAARGAILPVGWSSWPVPAGGDFRFGGAIAVPCPPPRAAAGLLEAAAELAREFDLRGLCGLDAVLSDAADGFRLLELNPRPPAGFELHERGGFLFTAHLEGCRSGRLPRRLPAAPVPPVRGLAVLYAARTGLLPVPWSWPAWVRDRPRPGSQVRAREPLCTVHAAASSPAGAARLLRRRCRLLGGLLGATGPGVQAAGRSGGILSPRVAEAALNRRICIGA